MSGGAFCPLLMGSEYFWALHVRRYKDALKHVLDKGSIGDLEPCI